MKKSIVIYVIALCAMALAGCEKEEVMKTSEINVEIGGEMYSAKYSLVGSEGLVGELTLRESEFSFNMAVNVSNGKNKIWLCLTLQEDSALELNKPYPLKDLRDEMFGGFCYVIDNKLPDFWIPYYYTEGYLTFTSIERIPLGADGYKYAGYSINGTFGFTAVNNNDDSDVVEVRNGMFREMYDHTIRYGGAQIPQ